MTEYEEKFSLKGNPINKLIARRKDWKKKAYIIIRRMIKKNGCVQSEKMWIQEKMLLYVLLSQETEPMPAYDLLFTGRSMQDPEWAVRRKIVKYIVKRKEAWLPVVRYDTMSWRMEVGLFFMPKIGQHRKLPRNTLTKNIKRGGSCAYKNHIGVYRMQAA